MEWFGQLIQRLGHMGPWTPLAFIAAYAVASVLLVPTILLTVSAGAIFGLWRGTLIVYAGALLGSSLVFCLGSPLAGSRLLHWLYRDVRVAAVRRAVAEDGLWVMFLLRLSPVVPFVLLNYGLALSGVRYRHFLIASVGMLPAIVMYVYYGKIVGDVAKIAAGVSPPRGPEYYVLVIVGLIATVVASTTVMRASRRAIDRHR